MSSQRSVDHLDEQCQLLAMDELELITGGFNNSTDFILWLLKQQQAAAEMIAFYSTQHAH
jgi:hypothetical protein